MSLRFLRVPAGIHPTDLIPARLEDLAPKVLLVADDPVAQEPEIRSLLEALSPHRRLGLVVAHPPRLGLSRVRRLIQAGLQVLQWRLATPVPGRYDEAFGGPGAMEQGLDWMQRCQQSLSGVDPNGRGRQFPPLWLEAWVPIEPGGLRHPGALARIISQLASRVHHLQVSLWSRRDASGRPRLPPFPLVAEEIRRAIEAWKALDPFSASAEFHLDGESGIPLCMLPDEESRVLLHPRPSTGNDATPTIPLCQSCAAGPICDAACRGPWRKEIPPGWEPHLRPLADGVPRWLIPQPGHAGYQDRDRAMLHQPRELFQSFSSWRDRRWNSDLQMSSGASRISLARGDRPPLRSGAPSFPVLLARLPVTTHSDRQGITWLPPLSLILLSSMLREVGLAVTTLDLAAEAHREGEEPDSGKELDAARTFCRRRLEETLRKMPDAAMVGLSLEDPDCLPLALGLFEDLGPSVFRVLGGRGVRNGPRILSEHPEVDAIIEGEGEVPLLTMVRRLLEHRGLDGIPGVIVRQGGIVLFHPTAEHSLDLVATPDLACVDFSLYPKARFPFQGERVAPYMFVHGCPYHCAFCADYTNGRMRVRDPTLVVRHLQAMISSSDCRNFVFLNTLINASPKYLDSLLDHLLPARLPIRWIDSAKPRNLTREQLLRLRQAGCESLVWGIDAASRRMNRRMTKGFDLDEASQILQWTHEVGIRSVVNLIAGLPGETDQDIEEVLEWMARHRPFVSHLNLMPYRFDTNSRIHLDPGRFGIRPTPDGQGYSDDAGRDWPAVQARIRETHHRYQEGALALGYCSGLSGMPFRR